MARAQEVSLQPVADEQGGIDEPLAGLLGRFGRKLCAFLNVCTFVVVVVVVVV